MVIKKVSEKNINFWDLVQTIQTPAHFWVFTSILEVHFRLKTRSQVITEIPNLLGLGLKSQRLSSHNFRWLFSGATNMYINTQICYMKTNIQNGRTRNVNKLAKAGKMRKLPGTLGLKKFGPGKIQVENVSTQNTCILAFLHTCILAYFRTNFRKSYQDQFFL